MYYNLFYWWENWCLDRFKKNCPSLRSLSEAKLVFKPRSVWCKASISSFWVVFCHWWKKVLCYIDTGYQGQLHTRLNLLFQSFLIDLMQMQLLLEGEEKRRIKDDSYVLAWASGQTVRWFIKIGCAVEGTDLGKNISKVLSWSCSTWVVHKT